MLEGGSALRPEVGVEEAPVAYQLRALDTPGYDGGGVIQEPLVLPCHNQIQVIVLLSLEI